MPGTNTPSFIPKRTPKKHSKKRVTRRIYIVAYIAYIVFFGTLIATAGVFVYQLQVKNQLVTQQQALIEERKKFSQAEMGEILELEQRLEFAKERVERHVSIASLFDSLEASVAETVQFASLDLQREEDIDAETGRRNGESIKLNIETMTDSFDSTLFQRSALEQNPTIKAIFVENVGIGTRLSTDGEDGDVDPLLIVLDESTRISFDIAIDVQLEDIPFNPFSNSQPFQGESMIAPPVLEGVPTTTETEVIEEISI